MSNRTKESTSNDEGSSDCGDLGQWEYLTNTYDHEPMLDNDSNVEIEMPPGTDPRFSSGKETTDSMHKLRNAHVPSSMNLLSFSRSDRVHQRNEPVNIDRILNFQPVGYLGEENVPIHQFTIDEIGMIDSSYRYNDRSFNFCNDTHAVSSNPSQWNIWTQHEPMYQPDSPTNHSRFIDSLSPRLTSQPSDCVSQELQLPMAFVTTQTHPNTIPKPLATMQPSTQSQSSLQMEPNRHSHEQTGSVAVMPQFQNNPPVSSAGGTNKKKKRIHSNRISHKSESDAYRTSTTNETLLLDVQKLLDSPHMSAHQSVNSLSLPLSPYNYFFRDERDNIVSGIANDNNETVLPSPVSDFSDTKLQQLLYQHWFIDPTKQKRVHRKEHGKIKFERSVYELLYALL
jgi:hypothetical protein